MRPDVLRLALLFLTLSASLLPAGAQTDAPNHIKDDAVAARAESPFADLTPNNAPPRIIFSDRPAVLILVDGSPVLRLVEGETDLLRVVNTRALVVSDRRQKKFYLRLMDGWLEADALEGSWWIAKDAPPALDRVKDELARGGQVDLLTLAWGDGRDGRANGSAAKSAPTFAQAARDGTFPVVYVSTTPAELIRTRGGGPRFKVIKDSKLLYVENTGGSIFYDTESRRFYVLISGRWLGSDALEGPWADVPGRDLPAGFKRIPAGHPRAGVLASVPGTPQAREARQNRAASVIQTTTAGP